jgi:ATP-dependent DNA helicase DinG
VDYAPPRPRQRAGEPAEARCRLAELLGEGAEARPQQADYASAIASAFAPRLREGEPQFVLAEAGTGVGKTLGYIAPASLWAERNDGTVWISTYTRNLQHQIDGELDRLYPTRARKAEKTVIRKGRENYLCLLNYEEAARGLQTRPRRRQRRSPQHAGRATRERHRRRRFSGWLVDLIGATDPGPGRPARECIYSACDHYRRCSSSAASAADGAASSSPITRSP